MPRNKDKRRNITERDCRTEVKKPRERSYDKDCKGLYVTLSPTAPPTFTLRYNCKVQKKRCYLRLGVYQQEASEAGQEPRNVAYWRKQAIAQNLKVADGQDIAASSRRKSDLKSAQAGMTVDRMIDLYVKWIKGTKQERVHTEDGVIIKTKPIMKSWAVTEEHLDRFVRPRLGKMIASEVTNRDIAQLQRDIIAGTLIINEETGRTCKAGSHSNARHMRKAVSGLSTWGAEVDRQYVTQSPCHNLPKLQKVGARKRRLSNDEIRTLWHGLDREDLVFDRKICLGLKYTLVMMLRTVEALRTERKEFGPHGLDSNLPLVTYPGRADEAGPRFPSAAL